jgi:Rrp15p
VPDFREGESGSDAEPGDDIESSKEEEDEKAGEAESGDDDNDKSKFGGKKDESEEEEEDEDDEQDALDADLAPSSEEEDDEEENAQDDEENSEGEEDDEGGLAGGYREEEPVSFLEGGKSETFARAFARIIDSSVPQTEQVLAAPILAGSKSLAARKAEDEAEAKAHRAAKKLRLEMRQRGHVVPKKRGADPIADAREKAFQKTATRGVVRLFNAVAKAQRRLREEEGVSGSRAKAAKLGKASFLAELRNSRAATEGKSEAVVPSARPTSEAAAAAAAGGAGGGCGDDGSDEEGGAGWAVLQQGFTGLQGGNKMKDWDKQMSEDESDGGAGDDSSDDE